MAKSEIKQVSRVKEKKKLWYRIISPKIFGRKEIGESYLASPETAIGRKLQLNLRDLTGNVRDQNVYVGFLINQVQGNQLYTSTVGYKLATAYVKRAVRKNTNRLDDTFRLKTSDGSRVVLKSLLITINKTHRSVQAALRKQLGESLKEELEKTDFETFISNLVNNRVQLGIKKRLRKIYPLKEIAIRQLALLGGKAEEKGEEKALPPEGIEEKKTAEPSTEESTEEDLPEASEEEST